MSSYLMIIAFFCLYMKTVKQIKGIFRTPRIRFYCCKRHSIPLLYYNNKALYDYSDVIWKDKYGAPRFEQAPYFMINFFKWSFIWMWETYPHENEYQYWEQILWYLYYTPNKDINTAKETWPWVDTKTNVSTWSDQFLIK